MLVVDDSRDVAELLSVHLSLQGYEVARAYDGVQTISSALFFRPRVIVLNFLMPAMNGDQALSYLRVHPATKNAKVIMTSAGARFEARCREAGADAFLIKPFSLRELDATIARLLA